MAQNVLVTGGAGYIGSHTVLELLEQDYHVIVVDNLVNSSQESIERVQKLTGKTVTFIQADVCDESSLDQIFTDNPIDAVIHFAGLKAVGESVSQPLRYYQNNLISTLSLCKIMQKHGVTRLIFSSSATVYGTPSELPLTEASQTGFGITNPYGQTKYMIEQMLQDLAVADDSWQITILRYFNPIGAHASGQIGEDPNGIPNNLLPFVAQVAVGKHPEVQVFSNDYDTVDGTGIRDYIHVVDLAQGHLAALQHDPGQGKVAIYNLGTGTGVSVLEAIHAFEQAAQKTIPYRVVARRPGDIASCYADCAKANSELSWTAQKSLQDGCNDAWHWQSQNPDGYTN